MSPSIPSADAAFVLPAPCTKEELRGHLLDIQLMNLRMQSFMSSDELAMRLLPRPVDPRLCFFDPDPGPADWEMRWEDYRDSSFCRAVECMYDFAYAGLIDESYESMGDETTFMWAAAVVRDVAGGWVSTCWDAFGTRLKDGSQILKRVVETAHARTLLENIEGFDPGDSMSGDLTVRQLALLSGMEEMSIRSAANPKKANALQVQATDIGTRITPEVAKAWLRSKGRYVEVRRVWGEADIDLTRKSLRNAGEVLGMLSDRLNARWLQADEVTRTALVQDLQRFDLPLIVRGNSAPFLALEPEHLRNSQQMRHLAVTLNLPPDLCVLRIREALASEDLQRVLREIREAVEAARGNG